MTIGIVAQRSRFWVVAAAREFALVPDFRRLPAYRTGVGSTVAQTFATEWPQLAAIADTGYRRPGLNGFGASIVFRITHRWRYNRSA